MWRAIFLLSLIGCSRFPHQRDFTPKVGALAADPNAFDRACESLRLQLEMQAARALIAELNGQSGPDDMEEAVAQEMRADYRLLCR